MSESHLPTHIHFDYRYECWQSASRSLYLTPAMKSLCPQLRADLPRARDLYGALVAPAALCQVAALPSLVHKREAVEGAHNTAVCGVHNALRRIALACSHALPSKLHTPICIR